MSVSIRVADSGKGLLQFIKMVWPIYEGDPNWVPPLIMDRKKLLNRKKNPFYQHAEMELFLAERDGKIVGRIAAIINRRHNETHNDDVGFFGFFEAFNDKEVAHALLRNAEEWLRERGMGRMRGPVNPSMNDEVGLLVEGFDDPPQILMTYNPNYYSALIESFGLAKVKDVYAYRLTPDFLSDKLERVQQRVRERSGLTIRNVEFSPKSSFRRDVAIIKDLHSSAWEPNWGFVPLTEAEFDALAVDLKQVAAPDLALIAEIKGKPVGFALTLPDINQVLIRNRNGGILGALYGLLFRKRSITRGRILVLGVIPQFQGHGLDAALYYETGQRIVHNHGYTEGEASWVLEDNVMMNRAATLMKGERYKTYRLYEKTINKN